MDETVDEIRRLAAKFVWREAVLPESRLWHDLRIGGDDAWELVGEVIDRFGTSFTDMPFSEFFPGETELFGAAWGLKLGFRSRKKPLTIQHMAEVVKRGVWFEPSGD